MKTGTTRNRWTIKETNLAKETLKLTNGNQKRAATILSNQLDRSVASIQVKLCFLAKKHPSLRKRNIARKMASVNAPTITTEGNTMVREVKRLEIVGNKLIITL
jgi:hypothetical protein